MIKQIAVGIIVIISLTAIGMTITTVQSQLQKGNDSVGGDIVEQQRNFGVPDKITGLRAIERLAAAPITISGDNVYIVWPTNRTGNDEVNFRASTDRGTTFADKINLSNSTNAESQDVEIAADGENVVILG